MKLNKKMIGIVTSVLLVAGFLIGTYTYNQHQERIHAQIEQKKAQESKKLRALHKLFTTKDLKVADAQLLRMKAMLSNDSTQRDKDLLKGDLQVFIKSIQQSESGLKKEKFDFNKIDDVNKKFDDFAKQVSNFKALTKGERDRFAKTIAGDKKTVVANLKQQKQAQNKKNQDAKVMSESQVVVEDEQAQQAPTQQANEVATQQATQTSQASDYTAPTSGYQASEPKAVAEKQQANEVVAQQATQGSQVSNYVAPTSNSQASESSYTAPESSHTAPNSNYQVTGNNSESPSQTPAGGLGSRKTIPNIPDNTYYYEKNQQTGGYDVYDGVGSEGVVTATIGY